MKPDCKNDCFKELLFPKRPNNRPGLSHIDYRIGTYSSIREYLLHNLNKDPILMDWTHRGADDPGIALLEGAAILGDILTFYQELYANEAYLRTAKWRESIADLVRLLGYRLSPGLGGRGTFAFEVKGDKPVVIPKGFPIKAQLEGIEKLAEFETIEEKIAYPWLSKFHLYRPHEIPSISPGSNEFLIEFIDGVNSRISLQKGDRLFIGDLVPQEYHSGLINSEVVIVDEVREEFGYQVIKIKGGLQRTTSIATVKAFKIGRSYRHFGHNSPRKTVIVTGGTASEKSISYVRNLDLNTSAYSTESTDIAGVAGIRILDPTLAPSDFPLDSEVSDLPLGSQLLIQGRFLRQVGGVLDAINFTHIQTVKNSKSHTMTWGVVNGATSVATINNQIYVFLSGKYYPRLDIREIQFHEALSPQFTLRGAPKDTLQLSGNSLNFYGNDAELQTLKNREILFSKPLEESSTAIVQTVSVSPPDMTERRMLRSLTLDREVDYADFIAKSPLVTVYGNLVEVNQGKTEKEAILGNGDHRQIFQTFKIPKSPLTYHNTLGETPPEVPELEIYVNDRIWEMVPSFFGRDDKEEIYIVREDQNGDSWVQFGDGKTGARLPSGIKNVKAIYRTGNGAFGPLKEETTVQSGGKLNKLDKIQLPGVVSGGSEAESGDNAREAAPGKVQSLNRLVSLKDFESETLAISGVSKVTASWDLVDNVPAVVPTVLMKTGRDEEIELVREILNGYNKCRGPQRFPIIVHQGKLQYVFIDVVFAIDPTFRREVVEKGIKEALGVMGEEGNGIDGSHGLFGIHSRSFGQNEYDTRIVGVIQNVEGVLWSKVTALGSLGEAEDPSELALPDEPKPLSQVVPCDNLHVLSLFKSHLQLNVAKSDSTEEC